VAGGYGSRGLRVQVGDVALYRWLQAIGLMPCKSLSLGAVAVPDEVFPHFVRGLLDGDGSILDITYNGTGKARGRRYRTLLVRFISASESHVTWLAARMGSLFAVNGALGHEGIMHTLTFGKRSSLRLLPLLYADESSPCLIRKRQIWERFTRENGETLPVADKMK
jgi:hypothetical protein